MTASLVPVQTLNPLLLTASPESLPNLLDLVLARLHLTTLPPAPNGLAPNPRLDGAKDGEEADDDPFERPRDAQGLKRHLGELGIYRFVRLVLVFSTATHRLGGKGPRRDGRSGSSTVDGEPSPQRKRGTAAQERSKHAC